MEVDDWKVVTRGARGNKDMRPIKTQKAKQQAQMHTNRFEMLAEDIGWIGVPEATDVDAVCGKEEGWERLPIKVDSGAVETVMPASMARHIPTTETSRSRNGAGFRAANGSHIKHHGQKTLKGYGDEFQTLNIIAQVADVKTALASVYRMVQVGNMVHFERGNCYIQHLETGTVTPMLEKKGGFEIGLWVESGPICLAGNQCFTRQDD